MSGPKWATIPIRRIHLFAHVRRLLRCIRHSKTIEFVSFFPWAFRLALVLETDRRVMSPKSRIRLTASRVQFGPLVAKRDLLSSSSFCDWFSCFPATLLQRTSPRVRAINILTAPHSFFAIDLFPKREVVTLEWALFSTRYPEMGRSSPGLAL